MEKQRIDVLEKSKIGSRPARRQEPEHYRIYVRFLGFSAGIFLVLHSQVGTWFSSAQNFEIRKTTRISTVKSGSKIGISSNFNDSD